jgi:hypothetical protein
MRFIGLGLLAPLSVLLACGGGAPTSQPAARDQAAAAACAYYMRCGQIGAGLKYASADDCTTQLKAYFNGVWPQDTCTSISATGFNNCIGAINIAECGSLADFLNVTLNKCTAANVCATDGGG